MDFGLRKNSNTLLWILSVLACLCVAGMAHAGDISTGTPSKPKGGTTIETDPSLEPLIPFYQPYTSYISAYKPMYFLFGTDLEDTKFQISFKYNIFNPQSDLAQRFPWITGIHFAYTQTSFWNLESDSIPFEDTSYMPEMFWISKNYSSGGSLFKGLFLKAGFQHESNGRADEESRSTNFLYVQPIFILTGRDDGYALKIAPKLWSYAMNENENNPDLYRYRGYFELELKAGLKKSFALGSSFRWANEGPSIILDLTHPLHPFLFNAVDFYLHIQYANALAENLLDYRERSHAFRIGFSMVR